MHLLLRTIPMVLISVGLYVVLLAQFIVVHDDDLAESCLGEVRTLNPYMTLLCIHPTRRFRFPCLFPLLHCYTPSMVHAASCAAGWMEQRMA